MARARLPVILVLVIFFLDALQSQQVSASNLVLPGNPTATDQRVAELISAARNNQNSNCANTVSSANSNQQSVKLTGLQQFLNLQQPHNPPASLQSLSPQNGQLVNSNIQQQQTLTLQQPLNVQSCQCPNPNSQQIINLQPQISLQPAQDFIKIQPNNQINPQKCSCNQQLSADSLQQSINQQSPKFQQPVSLQQLVLQPQSVTSLNNNNLQIPGQQTPIQSELLLSSLPMVNGQIQGLPSQVSQGVLLSNLGLMSNIPSLIAGGCSNSMDQLSQFNIIDVQDRNLIPLPSPVSNECIIEKNPCGSLSMYPTTMNNIGAVSQTQIDSPLSIQLQPTLSKTPMQNMQMHIIQPQSSTGQSVQLQPTSNQILQMQLVSDQALNLQPLPNSPMQVQPVSNQAVNLQAVANPSMHLQSVSNQALNLQPVSNPAMQVQPHLNDAANLLPVSNSAMQVQPVLNQAVNLQPVLNPVMQVQPVSNPALQLQPVPNSAIQIQTVPGQAVNLQPVANSAMQVQPVSNPALQIQPVPDPAIPVKTLSDEALHLQSTANPSIQLQPASNQAIKLQPVPNQCAQTQTAPSQMAIAPNYACQQINTIPSQAIQNSVQNQPSLSSLLLSQIQPQNQQYPNPATYPSSTSKSSSMKALLPLLFNLLKEKNGCSCANCNYGCMNNNPQEFQNPKPCVNNYYMNSNVPDVQDKNYVSENKNTYEDKPYPTKNNGKTAEKAEIIEGYSNQIKFGQAKEKENLTNCINSEEIEVSKKNAEKEKYEKYNKMKNESEEEYECDDDYLDSYETED